MKQNAFVLLILFLTSQIALSCTGGAFNQGNLNPNNPYQTVGVVNGDYFSINVTCGNQYNFDFCGNGGSAGSLWAEITVLDATGTTEYAFAPYSGGCTTLSWTATFTGTIRLLITDSGCSTSGSWNGTMAYNETSGGPLDPSFTMSELCGGASATVTGTSGGTFSFDPNPGDGSSLDPVTGSIANAVEGTTYTVEYSICGTTSTESVLVTEDDNCWTLNGDAQYINVAGEQCIQLTDEINNQTGCAWSGDQIDFAGDFSLTLDYYFGNNIGGADGNTFTFQPSASTACGQAGGQLGAGGLSNALAIEFDTYDNDNPTHLYDMSCDHIAVEVDGNMQGAAPYCGPVCAKPGGQNIDDGGTYTVDIVWDASAQQLDIFFDGNLRLSCTGDFVNTVFGGQSQVYWGATSATGGLNNQQYFCPSTVVILPAELSSFQSTCNDKSERFEWTSVTEQRVDYYSLEYTYDGLVFHPEVKINAVGNSQEEQNYSAEVTTNDPKQRYYRLRIVDTDGHVEYTELISSKRCAYGNDIITNVSQSATEIIISTKNNAVVEMINPMGQVIHSAESIHNSMIVPKQQISEGIYIINARTDNGEVQSKKIFVKK